jgi:hypothetical protein
MEEKSRIEKILENILGGSHEILDPVSRNETLLIQIAELIENSSAEIEIISSSDIDEIINTIN